MVKKKCCHWLNSKQEGNIVLRHGHIEACCTRRIQLLDNSVKYENLTLEDIQSPRIQLFEDMNKYCEQCKNCGFLYETDEDDVEVGKINYIIYHPHTTCNLRCCYCPYVKDGSVFNKFDSAKYNPYKDIQNFHKIGLFKESITFEFGGGEPMLLGNIPESLEFLSEHYPNGRVVFVSNFSLSKQVDDVINTLKNRKIRSVLKTSIDCGTVETYAKIRGQNLFNKVKSNLIKACKENAFDEIMLKYIFLENGSNSKKEDINGFINLVKEVKKYNKNKTTVILDADMSSLYENNFTKDVLSHKILKSAAEIYASCIYDIKCEILWHGERFSIAMPNGKAHIEKIIQEGIKIEKTKKLIKSFRILWNIGI